MRWLAGTALGQAVTHTLGLLIAGLLLLHLGARRGRRTAKDKADARDLRRSSDLRTRVDRERLRRVAQPPDIRYRD
ncbi:hypothetical protein [Sagittula stellata]|uniref:Uncharacterized protein n=1 Tax=Sagittula stellata (strain ATCC 700073 / DSM 11524 / E-37) TaxID=388399 RepID=A3K175_SAGS3|nr:hypothetical protein [Sagittula stellata]EBA08671.1 hypothetical protein SSE37_03475 [Sagittula stellata E-37]